MENNFVDVVRELYVERKWKTILKKFHKYPERNRLLWVFPSEENLGFLSRCLKELHCDNIISVGCGSGLLEWIITEATGIQVKGIEVDGAWWQCKYAPPTFITLHFTTNDIDDTTAAILRSSRRGAILFCYFNSGVAFENYIKHFSGAVLVIIGPGDEKAVHTDPKPFGDNIGGGWELYKSQQVRNDGDYIAVYYRNVNKIGLNEESYSE